MNYQKHAFSLGLGILVMLGLLIGAPAAWSDWDPGDPHKMHYPQLPDLENGIDVMTFTGLADDFQCSSTGPITAIHLWGSFLDDNVYSPTFELSIFSDGGSATSSYPFSDLLWFRTFNPGEYSMRLYATMPEGEVFVDPGNQDNPIAHPVGTDTQVWQFNFFIDEEPLVQTEESIYWLVVDTNSEGFGWKTSSDRWRSSAYNSFGVEFGMWPFDYGGERDMAFVINTPIPPSMLLLGTGLLGLGLLGRRRKLS
jgi:hypothetical protein